MNRRYLSVPAVTITAALSIMVCSCTGGPTPAPDAAVEREPASAPAPDSGSAILPGGYTAIDPADPVIEPARAALLALLNDLGNPAAQVVLDQAATQVVAGLNVRFAGSVSGAGTLHAVVYQGFDGSAEVSELTVGGSLVYLPD